MMDYTEVSDLYDTALGDTNLSYTENNLSYESWVVEWTSRLMDLSDSVDLPEEAS